MRNRRVFARTAFPLIVVGLLATSFVAPGAAQTQCVLDRDGDWLTVHAPAFPQGPRAITSFRVDPRNPDTIYLTNGLVVMRSADFGCAWDLLYALSPPGALGEPSAADSTITSIAIPSNAPTRVYLAVEQRVGQVTRPHIIRSEDHGATWSPSSVGLPPVGAIQDLIASPSEPQLAYVGLDTNGGAIDTLYATTDGGTTWNLRSDPTDLRPSSGITGFALDPTDGTSVWAYGTGAASASGESATAGLLHSTDGGRTFADVPEFAQRAAAPVDVFHGSGQPARIVAFRPGFAEANRSTDGGRNWPRITSPTNVDSVAPGETRHDMAATANGEVFGWNEAVQSWINLNAPSDGVRGLQSDRAAFWVYGYTPRSVEIYQGELEDPPQGIPDELFDVPLVQTPETPQRHPETLRPANRRIVLDPGDDKTVRYRLTLPRRPLPLNVFFLLDTSDSMGATIEDLARSTARIINDLQDRYISLKVGIGAFRAYPDRFPPSPSCEDQATVQQRCEKNYVFKLIHQIQTPNAAMSASLAELESDAGGFYKSHLGALYQLATGEGQDLFPPGPGGHDVPEGLNAVWDEKALKVVIHATDERFGREVERDSTGSDFGNPEPPDIPSFEEVAAAFDWPGERDLMDLKQVGLSIGSPPKKDLQRVAAMTGALATTGGVDCNGDGKAEVAEGSPLVCDIRRTNLERDATNLVPAIVNLLEGLPQATDIELEVEGNEDVLAKVSPEVHQDVVLQTEGEVLFDVAYKCPVSMQGERFRFKLTTRTALGRELASARATVVCTEDPPPPALPLPVINILALLPPVPPPPPPPVSQLTSSTQAQGQAQAQAGAATQEEEQPQVAVAAAYKKMLEQRAAMEYEMVGYERRREPVSPLFVLGVGSILAACAYGATLARERVQLAYQRRR